MVGWDERRGREGGDGGGERVAVKGGEVRLFLEVFKNRQLLGHVSIFFVSNVLTLMNYKRLIVSCEIQRLMV